MRGWFDNLFGGGGQAEASHILIKGSNADAKVCAYCEYFQQDTTFDQIRGDSLSISLVQRHQEEDRGERRQQPFETAGRI